MGGHKLYDVLLWMTLACFFGCAVQNAEVRRVHDDKLRQQIDAENDKREQKRQEREESIRQTETRLEQV